MTETARRKAMTAVVAMLFLYAAWHTFERAGFLIGMATLGRANAAQGVGSAQMLGAGLSFVNFLSALFSILAAWAVAALAWLMLTEQSVSGRHTGG